MRYQVLEFGLTQRLRLLGAAVVLSACARLGAQTVPAPSVTPGNTPTSVRIDGGLPRVPKQPPVSAGPDLPLAPEPQRVSSAVSFALAARTSMPLGHGVSTPVATGDALPLTLDDAVRLGLERNLAMVADAQNERSVDGLRLTAANALIPSLTANASSATQEINLAAMGFKPQSLVGILPPGSPAFPTIVKVDTTAAQLRLNQQLFNLPALEVYRAAKYTVEGARNQTLLDRGDVVQRVATQYLRVLADAQSIRNAEAQLARDVDLESQAKAKKDAGVGTNLDLLRATVDRQRREQELVQQTASFAKDKVQLNRLMGLAADQQLTLVDAVPYHELEALPLETAKQVAYKRRKDLLVLQSQLHVVELERKAIKYERLPAATLGGYYGVLGETRGLYHGVFLAQGGINFPIFQEARIRGDREVADAQLTRLRRQRESLMQDIERDLRATMLDVTTASDLVKSANSNVALATEALDETQLRYRAGVDDTLPVFRAQATLANAQSQLVNALLQFNTAKLQLARNTGVIESQYDSYLGE